VLQTTVEDRAFDGDGVMRSVTITNPAGTVKTWSMTWDPTRPNGEVLSWQSSGQRTSFLYGNERAASMNATGLQSYEYNPLGDIIAGRAGTVESTGYAPYGKGDTLNATVEPRFGYRGEIQIGNRVHLRARDLNTSTARFDRKDPLAGIPGETVETNQYHYANNDPIGQIDPSGLQPTDDTFALPLPTCTGTGKGRICVAGLTTGTPNSCPDAGPVPTVPYTGVPTIPCMQVTQRPGPQAEQINRAALTASFGVAIRAQQQASDRRAALCLYSRGSNCETFVDPVTQYSQLIEARSMGFSSYRTYADAMGLIAATNDVLGDFANRLRPIFNVALDAVGNAGFWAGAVAVVAFAVCPITLGTTCVIAGAASAFSTGAGIIGTVRSCAGSLDRSCAINAISTAVAYKTGSKTAGRSFGSALQSFVSLVLGQEGNISKYGICDIYRRDSEGYCR
jgi:RHS repeat-associated protein